MENSGNLERSGDNDFIFENIDRYRLTVHVGRESYTNTGNILPPLLEQYEQLVTDNLDSNEHVVITIFDYDKNTDIYSYDSEYDR